MGDPDQSTLPDGVEIVNVPEGDVRLVRLYGADVLIGRTLGTRYRLRRILGRGATATVFLAEDLNTGQERALKILVPTEAAQRVSMGSDELTGRFVREARHVRDLRHPNVIRVYEVGGNEHFLFMVMERLSGVSLQHRLTTSVRLDASDAVAVALQIARGLGAAHEHGLLHRDVKPANIWLVDDDPRDVRVLDFGVALPFSSDEARLTGTGRVVGSPEYMSPEQARGRALDSRTDVYALGIVLYEMLTGTTPFREADPRRVMLRHVRELPKPIEEIHPHLATERALLDFCRRCLRKGPDDRFTNGNEAAWELERIAQQMGLEPLV